MIYLTLIVGGFIIYLIGAVIIERGRHNWE